MGCASPEEILNGTKGPGQSKGGKKFQDATMAARERYFATFDPSYERRQSIYAMGRAQRITIPATPWFGWQPGLEETE
jgi:hypothetical protein